MVAFANVAQPKFAGVSIFAIETIPFLEQRMTDGLQPQRFPLHDLTNYIPVYNNSFILFMNKLTQAEIDELAKDSDEEQKKEEPLQEEYQEEFEEQVEEEYPQQQEMNESIQNDNEGYKIEDEPEVQSEIASEKLDEVISEKMGSGSDFQFKKDEDLSQAQSEFIESSRLNDGAILKIKSNMKTPQNSKESQPGKGKINNQKKATQKVKPKPVIKKPISKKAPVKQPQKQGENKKEKLSESEIARRMKDIENEKREMQRKKEEKQKKEDEARRKEYQQAKQKQEQKKEKNKRILEEQRKKKPASQVKVKEVEQQVKIPQKRLDYKYMDMKKQRMQNQKMIQKKIEQQNLLKLKRLNQNRPSELKGQAKKLAFIQERNDQLLREKKQKKMEEKEEDVLVIKQIKKEILQCKRFNLQKTQDINRAEKSIEDLKKKIREKEKLLYQADAKGESTKEDVVYDDLSQLTPIQKFVQSFPESKNVDEIFGVIDANGDGVLSSAEIHQKLVDFGLEKEIIDKLEELLDENSDGTVSHEEFVFLVQLELKRQRDYRQILGELSAANPIDLQAKIIDMQAKLKYISKQIDNYRNNNEDEAYQAKLQQLQKKSDKIEDKIKRQNAEFVSQDRKELGANTIAHLTNEYIRLKNQKGIRLAFLEKLRTRVKQNLAEKNKLLGTKVEENLRLQQEVYKIKNQIQERELRFLSMKKIEENKRGYLERQTQKRKEMEEAYKRTKEYEVLISDPTKKAQKNALADEMKFLAAVLMIQRNYRKRKARGEFEKLRQQASK